MVFSCLGRLAMFAQPSRYIVALPYVSETNKKEKKRERDKIVDVPVEREREVRCVVHGVVVENLGGNSYPLARWPWHRSCIRYLPKSN